MREERVEYRDAELELSGVLVWDDALDARRPGVLVVHGGAGLDDHARAQAKRFAELGLVALACDMYGQDVTGDRQRVMACVTELRDDPAKMTRRARAGIEVLATQPLVDGRLAAVGYCFGGLAVLQLARRGVEIAGVVCVHGSLATPERASPGEIRARILVCHGALDPYAPPSEVAEFIEEMNDAGADWQMNVYGGAMHGFTHDAVSATPGVAYDAEADARSLAAIRGFLAELFA